jgi:anti-sigma factor RsiW
MSIKTKIMCWMLRAMGLPTCEAVDQCAYDFLEQTLDPKTTRAVERHLALCASCQHFIAAYRKTRALTTAEIPGPLDREFKEKIFEFLKQRGGGF